MTIGATLEALDAIERPLSSQMGTPEQGRPGSRSSADTSTSVGKALSLLNAFLGPNGAALGVSEIARRAGVAKSTAHRLLAVLESHGLVERAGDRWLPGAHLFRLGNTVSMCRPRRLRDQALPHMQVLSSETQAMVNLAVLHGPQVLYVEKLAPRGCVESPASIGGCMPVYCTAVGKAMLAFSPSAMFEAVAAAGMPALTTRTITSASRLAEDLATIRRVGFALDQQESKAGLACVAVPIRRQGRVIAGLSLSLDVRRGLPQQHVARLVRAAEAISLSSGLDDEDFD